MTVVGMMGMASTALQERAVEAALSAHVRAIEGGYQRTSKHMHEIVSAYLAVIGGGSAKAPDVTRRLARSARAFLRYFNPSDLPEDASQQWQALEHLCDLADAATGSPAARVTQEDVEAFDSFFKSYQWNDVSQLQYSAVRRVVEKLRIMADAGGGNDAGPSWADAADAPRDGSEVLLWLRAPYSRKALARWYEPWAVWIEGELPDEADETVERYGIGSMVPSHYLATPAPPSEATP